MPNQAIFRYGNAETDSMGNSKRRITADWYTGHEMVGSVRRSAKSGDIVFRITNPQFANLSEADRKFWENRDFITGKLIQSVSVN
jgi:hypothetical protein